MAEGHMMAEQHHQPSLLRPPLPQTAPILSSPSCPPLSDHIKHKAEHLALNDKQKLFKVVLKVPPNNNNINSSSSPSPHSHSHASSPPSLLAPSASFFHASFQNHQNLHPPSHPPYSQSHVLHSYGQPPDSHHQQRNATDPDVRKQDLSSRTPIYSQIKQIPGSKEAEHQISGLQPQNSPNHSQLFRYVHAQRQIPHLPSPSLSQLHQLPQFSITEEKLQEPGVRNKEEGEGVVLRKVSPSCELGPNGLPCAHSRPFAAESPFGTTYSEVGQTSCKKRKVMEVFDSIKDEGPSAVVPFAYDVSQPKNANPLHPTLRPRLMPVDKLLQYQRPEAHITSSNPDSKDTTAPGKKLLKAILDKLQKKDKYGVFSEPVDSKEVPDYYDVIKDPMDFGTMRKKITAGYYNSLEVFEKDILTVCNNAMQYNRKGTVYHRQAASIKEASNKIMEYLKSLDSISNLGGEVIAKLRVWGPYAKKSLKGTAAPKAFDPTISENMSEVSAVHAADGDGQMHVSGSNGNLGRLLERLHGHAATPLDINSEEYSARRHQLYDEIRRNTYRSLGFSNEGTGSLVTSISCIPPQFVPTGYQLDFSYARSLARFAADLGPVIWKIAAEKVQRALPPGYPFGPGWVGERDNVGGAFVAPLKKPLPLLLQAYASPQMMKVPNDFPSSTSGDSHAYREGSSRNMVTRVTQVNLNKPPGIEPEMNGKNEANMPSLLATSNSCWGSSKDLEHQISNMHRDHQKSAQMFSSQGARLHAPLDATMGPCVNASSSSVFQSDMVSRQGTSFYSEQQPFKEVRHMGSDLPFEGRSKILLQEKLPELWTVTDQSCRMQLLESSTDGGPSEEIGTDHGCLKQRSSYPCFPHQSSGVMPLKPTCGSDQANLAAVNARIIIKQFEQQDARLRPNQQQLTHIGNARLCESVPQSYHHYESAHTPIGAIVDPVHPNLMKPGGAMPQSPHVQFSSPAALHQVLTAPYSVAPGSNVSIAPMEHTGYTHTGGELLPSDLALQL